MEEEKTGQLTITNYGLVQAKNVVLNLYKTDTRFKYEFFGEVPNVLLPKEKIVIPYRVTAVDSSQTKSIETKTAIQSSLLKAIRASDDCASYSAAYSEVLESDCTNGDTSKGNSSGYFYMYKGNCPSTGSGWGSGGMLGGNDGYSAGNSGIISPATRPITPSFSPEADCVSGGEVVLSNEGTKK